jgi:hypothetical protein
MWAKTSSSPMWATGVVRPAMMSAMPSANAAALAVGTGRPCRASVRARIAYAPSAASGGSTCNGSKTPPPT